MLSQSFHQLEQSSWTNQIRERRYSSNSIQQFCHHDMPLSDSEKLQQLKHLKGMLLNDIECILESWNVNDVP